MTTLGKAVEFLDSKRRPVTESERVEGPYPYYGANGLQGNIDNFIFDEPLVLLAEDGGHFGNPQRGIAYRISGKTWVNNHAHVLRPKPGLDLGYLCRVLENYDVTPFVTGTTRGKLTKAGASEIPIPLPPIEVQRRIAAILDQADALRVKRREALAQMDSLTQSLFIEMFGDPLLNPKQWPATRLGNEVKLQGGYAFKSSDYIKNGVRLVKISNVHKDNLTWDDVDELPSEYLNTYGAFRLFEGDIVLALTRPIIQSLESVKIAVVSETDTPSLLNQRGGRFVFRKESKIEPSYLLEFCRSSAFFLAVKRFCSESLQPNMSTSQVEALEIPLPPLELQRDFGKRIRQIEAIKPLHYESVIQFDSLFASLQHRAFQGEL